MMIEADGMVDEILRPLEDAGVTVRFQYQEEKLTLPAVTYYILHEAEGFRADGREQSQIVKVQVDIWSKKRSEMSRTSVLVNERMQENGWMRELSRDLPKETEKQAYHRTMRFGREIWSE